MSEISNGLSNIAYFRTDGGSSKLYTQEYVNEKDKEIDRLNNIINELKKVIQENKFWIYNDVLETRENFEVIDVEYILDKLKALKENK